MVISSQPSAFGEEVSGKNHLLWNTPSDKVLPNASLPTADCQLLTERQGKLKNGKYHPDAGTPDYRASDIYLEQRASAESTATEG